MRLAAVALLSSICIACAATSGTPAKSEIVRGIKAPDGKPIVKAIKAYLGGKPLSQQARLVTAFTDLNGDGVNEVVVYLLDPSFCGSGGCNTFILSQAGPDWHVVGNITITHPPIYRLPRGKDGWAELGVTVSGGGLARTVMAVPHGEGGYVRNPTMPPARPINPRKAEVLISQAAESLSTGG